MDLEGLDSGAIGWLFTLPLQTTRYSPQDVLVGGCSTGVQYSRNERSTRVVNSQQLNSFHSFKQQIYTDITKLNMTLNKKSFAAWLLAVNCQMQHITSTDPCTLLTEAEFNAVAPSATAPYTYAGLCTAITDWNTDNPSNQIFMGTTEMEQRHELAAFLGNTLHESGGFAAARECE